MGWQIALTATDAYLAAAGDLYGGVALDATNVYGGDFILRCSLGGCGTASANNPPTVLRDDTDTVFTCALGANGCTSLTSFPNVSLPAATVAYGSAVAVNGGNAYWPCQNGDLVKCSTGGCGTGPTILYMSSQNALSPVIAVDSSSVYWVDSSAAGLLSVPIGGGSPTVLTNTADATSMAVDATNIYWSTLSGVAQCAIADCATTVKNVGTGSAITAIAVDADNVYWTDMGPCAPGNFGQCGANAPTNTGTVSRCAIAGCTQPTTLASGLTQPTGIAVDATSVYFATYELTTVHDAGSTSGSPVTTLLKIAK
jgi:hypothetical protein